jgi:hypothetical protein
MLRFVSDNAIVSTFAPDRYYREPIGPHPTHRGPAKLRPFVATRFSAGGGIGLDDIEAPVGPT